MNTMLVFLYTNLFIVGCCVASFINVVIYRIPLGLSVVKGRSFCPSCHHQLHAIDLIPILSYVSLGGKCRYCQNHIPIRDTFLELLGGILALLCFYRFGFNWFALLSFVFVMVLQAISFIDLDTMEIPNSLVICCLMIALLSVSFMDLNMIDRLIGFFVLSVPLYLLNYVIPDSFGGGDIRLLAVCGLFLGWKKLLVGMFIAIFLAGGYACYLLVRGKIEMNGHIAFGPYICVGMFVSLLYGTQIFNVYLWLFV